MPSRLRGAPLLALVSLAACPPPREETTTGTTDVSTTSAGVTTDDATSDELPTTGATTTTTTDTTTASTGDTTTGSTGQADSTSDATGTTAGTTTTGDTSTGDDNDSDSDAPCEGVSVSDLAGVTIVFPPQDCEFTLAEVQAGITFQYEVHIDAAIADVDRVRQDASGTCDAPGDSGLIVEPEITGDGQAFSEHDKGLCPGNPIPAIDLAPGVYPGTLLWTGLNWAGPNQCPGASFPPGEYTVEERAIGSWKPQGQATDYLVSATLVITIVP